MLIGRVQQGVPKVVTCGFLKLQPHANVEPWLSDGVSQLPDWRCVVLFITLAYSSHGQCTDVERQCSVGDIHP